MHDGPGRRERGLVQGKRPTRTFGASRTPKHGCRPSRVSECEGWLTDALHERGDIFELALS